MSDIVNYQNGDAQRETSLTALRLAHEAAERRRRLGWVGAPPRIAEQRKVEKTELTPPAGKRKGLIDPDPVPASKRKGLIDPGPVRLKILIDPVPSVSIWRTPRIYAMDNGLLGNVVTAVGAAGLNLNLRTAETWRPIARIVADLGRVSLGGVIGGSRRKDYVRARHIFVSLMVALTPHSLPTIGRILYRDHTSIMHGWQNVGQEVVNALMAYGTDEVRERTRFILTRRKYDRFLEGAG